MAMLLMTPGPTRIPERVLRAGARPMTHHRDTDFSKVLVTTLAGLRPLFGAAGDVIPVHATGRGAMEASICNLLSPGDEVIVCANGRRVLVDCAVDVEGLLRIMRGLETLR